MQHKLEHIVIIVKENHTFDNYFGRFPGANGDPNLAHAPNPPASDHPHTHEAWLKFAEKAVKEQYTERDLAAYWKLAKQFTLCDHYFTDVAGPSTPNHLMLITADSPVVDNIHESSEKDAKHPGGVTFVLPSLPKQLEKAGLTWKNYGGYAFQYIKDLAKSPHTVPSEQFIKDAKAGTLPAVSWLYAGESTELYGNLSEHPPANITPGMEWTMQQIKALVDGGLWDTSAVFITWDDWGGWYDHVTPPKVEAWKDGTQFRYGPRVPCLVVGPYAKKGHISSKLHSHTSVVRFCEDIFGLPPINQRAKTTNSMTDCFDFAQTPLAPPKL
jgi:phospholipase C